MAFNVNFYQYAKKINSTARPTGTPTIYSCRVKEPCSVFSPEISLNLGLADAPTLLNYAYIAAFNRYYFVKNWTFNNALWTATLEVDVMASWKTEIGTSECYVLRSSQLGNGDIMDTTYPATTITTLDEEVGATPWETEDLESGTFVVGIAGQSTTYYLFSYDALQYFFEYIFSDVYADALMGLWLTLYPQLKAQTNPLQYITQIMWLPFYTTGTSVETIRVGWVDVPVVADRVDGSGIRAGESSFAVHRHPQDVRGGYLNNAPYSSYMLFYPPWGTIPLDPDIMANANDILATWLVDLRTGQGTLTISASNGVTDAHIMSWTHSQVGVPYQVSQVLNRGYGIGNMLAPAISGISGAMTKNFAGIASTAAAEIGNFASSRIPSATTVGSNGGINALRGYPSLQAEFKEVVEADVSHRGKPLCQVMQIDTLSGYILVANAYISIAATQEEKNVIISFMEGGFYFE